MADPLMPPHILAAITEHPDCDVCGLPVTSGRPRHTVCGLPDRLTSGPVTYEVKP